MSNFVVGLCHAQKECLFPAFEAIVGSGGVTILLSLMTGMMHGIILVIALFVIYQTVVSLQNDGYSPIAMFLHIFRLAALATFVFIIIGT